MLVEAGLVAIEKMTQGNRPQTTCRVTAAGRERFQEYLAALEKVIADAASIARSPANPGLIPRWHSG